MSYFVANVKGIDLVKHVDSLPEELCSDGLAIAKGGYYCLTDEGNKTREQTNAKDKCRYQLYSTISHKVTQLQASL